MKLLHTQVTFIEPHYIAIPPPFCHPFPPVNFQTTVNGGYSQVCSKVSSYCAPILRAWRHIGKAAYQRGNRGICGAVE